MAANALADTGFIVALLNRRDNYHSWAVSQASEFPPPWYTCEAVISEAVHLLGPHGLAHLAELLNRRALVVSFQLGQELKPVLALMTKYGSVPMGLADACLVRMTETIADSIVLTINTDFRIYRRHSRQVVPSIMP